MRQQDRAEFFWVLPVVIDHRAVISGSYRFHIIRELPVEVSEAVVRQVRSGYLRVYSCKSADLLSHDGADPCEAGIDRFSKLCGLVQQDFPEIF